MDPFLQAFVRSDELFGQTNPAAVQRIGAAQPDFLDQEIPCVVIRDPLEDTIVKFFEGGGDIRNVSMAIGEKVTYLALETRKSITPEFAFLFHLRLFGSSDVVRLDIKVEKGESFCMRSASNSIVLREAIPTTIKKNRVLIEIPSSRLTGSRECMLSADAYVAGKLEDKTAWRRLKLSD